MDESSITRTPEVDQSNVLASRTRTGFSPAESEQQVTPTKTVPKAVPVATAKIAVAKEMKTPKDLDKVSVGKIKLFKKLPKGIKATPVRKDQVGVAPYCYMRAGAPSGRFLCKVKLGAPVGVDKNEYNCVISWLDGYGEGDTTTTVGIKEVTVGAGYYRAVKLLMAKPRAA